MASAGTTIEEGDMADTNGATDGNTEAMDISAHRDSYQRFMGWLKLGAVVSFITTAIVVIIVAS